MNLLPEAKIDWEQRIKTILDVLGDVFLRSSELTSSCHVKGPCQAHPDRGSHCQGTKGVAYYVYSGPLKGTWEGWGEEGDRVIFDRMVARLNVEWRRHLDEYSKVADSLRAVGR